MPGAVADALALEGGLEQLAPRAGLLLLDNCEHVLDGAAAVVEELLARCPDLRVVATSRARSGVDGEQVIRLMGLPGDAAVALFRDRATAAGVDADDPAVAELCGRLDGLPLAIELAAGRARSLAPSEIVERLDERLDMLAVWGGARRRAIGRCERRSPGRTSCSRSRSDGCSSACRCFARGCSLAEAEAVCASDGAASAHVGGLLDELVAHSLLVTGMAAGRTSYTMLETLREYAAERLEERGERDTLRERHAAYYVAQAREMVDAGWREHRLPFLDAFDELRVATRWCLSVDGDPSRSFALAEVLWWPALARHGEEIARLLDEILARWPGAHAPAARARRGLDRRADDRRPRGCAEPCRGGDRARSRHRRAGLLARRTLAQLAYYSGESDPGPGARSRAWPALLATPRSPARRTASSRSSCRPMATTAPRSSEHSRCATRPSSSTCRGW